MDSGEQNYFDDSRRQWARSAKVERSEERFAYLLSLGAIAGGGAGVYIAVENNPGLGAILAGFSFYGAKSAYDGARSMRRRAKYHQSLVDADSDDEVIRIIHESQGNNSP